MAKMMDLQERIRHLDQCEINIQVLSTWIDMFGYDLPEDVGIRYHTRINEGLAEAVAAYPSRLRFLASVPLPWGEAAASVLQDAVARLGAVGAWLGQTFVTAILMILGSSPSGQPVRTRPAGGGTSSQCRRC